MNSEKKIKMSIFNPVVISKNSKINRSKNFQQSDSFQSQRFFDRIRLWKFLFFKCSNRFAPLKYASLFEILSATLSKILSLTEPRIQ